MGGGVESVGGGLTKKIVSQYLQLYFHFFPDEVLLGGGGHDERNIIRAVFFILETQAVFDEFKNVTKFRFYSNIARAFQNLANPISYKKIQQCEIIYFRLFEILTQREFVFQI